ncbi:MAG TPA: HEAT repeat domain-containing protein [Thiolapillus brandeum]|uniref:HEAT repeat domain-containing protein n=1 Tax=Thiolapillus brandeum TaxID=1076588 RepID=A0A831WD76_9GAMM|nr:HEAT repeat domain-containing protein [Thiolapillus brandeum]
MSTPVHNPADALLLIAPGCPHCQSVLHALSDLVKSGDIGRLEVVNIAVHPETAQEAGTRSVPWMRIGNYELNGSYSTGELKSWAEKAATGAPVGEYIRELLEQQQLDQAIAYIKEHPDSLPQLLDMMQDEEGSLSVKFGLGAIFEALSGSDLLKALVPELGKLATHDKANLRGDAAYYLGLSGAPEAARWLKPLLDDPQDDVREIAAEALDTLGQPT